LYYYAGVSRAPLSFPTRRSSDLERHLGEVLPQNLSIDPSPVPFGLPLGSVRVDSGHLGERRAVLDLRADLLRKLLGRPLVPVGLDRKSTRLNSSHEWISYAVFCL